MLSQIYQAISLLDLRRRYEGPLVIGAIITMGLIASAYAAVVAAIGFILLKMLKKRSVGLGALYGLGIGAAVSGILVIFAMSVI